MVGLIGALFVLYEDETLPQLAPGLAGDAMLATQVGVTLFLAVYLGFEGSQVILGSFIGLATAYSTEEFLASEEKLMPFFFFAWSCFCAAMGVVIFHGSCRQSILAALSALIGGWFVVSGAGTMAAQSGVLPILSKDIGWFDSANALFGNAGVGHLAIQGALAILTSIIYVCTKKGPLAAAPMGLGLGIGAIATATGLGCNLVHSCPPWLIPAQQSAWPFLGGLAWMAISVGGAILQLSNLGEDEMKKASKKATSKKKGAREHDPHATTSETVPLTSPQLHMDTLSPTHSGFGGQSSFGQELPPTNLNLRDRYR